MNQEQEQTLDGVRKLVEAYQECEKKYQVIQNIVHTFVDSACDNTFLCEVEARIFEALTVGLTDEETTRAYGYLKIGDADGIWCLHYDKEGVANERI